MTRFSVFSYRCDDPDVPPRLRCVAHWVDERGVAQQTIAWGETPEACAAKLERFLADEIGKAEAQRAGRAKGRAAMAAKRAS